MWQWRHAHYVFILHNEFEYDSNYDIKYPHFISARVNHLRFYPFSIKQQEYQTMPCLIFWCNMELIMWYMSWYCYIKHLDNIFEAAKFMIHDDESSILSGWRHKLSIQYAPAFQVACYCCLCQMWCTSLNSDLTLWGLSTFLRAGSLWGKHNLWDNIIYRYVHFLYILTQRAPVI